jgi:hypothetical protein
MSNRFAGCAVLVASGILFFLHDWMPASCWQFFETGFSLRGFFYFALGLYIAANPVDRTSFRRVRPLIPLAWLGTSLLFTYFRLNPDESSLAWQRLLAKAINLSGVGAVWVAYDFIPSMSKLSRHSFAGDSFFLYAAHLGIILTLFCARFQDILAMKLHIPALGIFAFRFIVPILLSLTTAELLKRHCPKIYALLTGGR